MKSKNIEKRIIALTVILIISPFAYGADLDTSTSALITAVNEQSIKARAIALINLDKHLDSMTLNRIHDLYLNAPKARNEIPVNTHLGQSGKSDETVSDLCSSFSHSLKSFAASKKQNYPLFSKEIVIKINNECKSYQSAKNNILIEKHRIRKDLKNLKESSAYIAMIQMDTKDKAELSSFASIDFLNQANTHKQQTNSTNIERTKPFSTDILHSTQTPKVILGNHGGDLM